MKRRLIPVIVGLVAMLGSACSSARTESEKYSVDIDPGNFVAGIDNAYFPLAGGKTFIYEGDTEKGLEHIEVVVLPETREVMGIAATAVRDTVTVDGVLIEDTIDWYAQDSDGNVWYMGEDVTNYDGGVATDKSGSWEAGIDGALPGIVMYADPAAHSGETYRQEYYPGKAEDMAEIVSVDGQVNSPLGTFEEVVQTLETTPLEPDAREHKFYAPGVGLIQETDVNSGEVISLVAIVGP